jgi:microcystin-dependent protein
MSYLYPAHPNNLTDLSTIVIESVTPQLRMCQNVLYYSQAIIGDYKYSARSDDHLGWMICDGRLLDRVQYKALFDIIGTTFGNTNSSNFRMPDFRGRVFGGLNVSGNLNNAFSVRNLGDATGEEAHTLNVNEMPAHNHGGVTGAAGFSTSVQGIFAANSPATNDAGDNTGSHTHSISSQGGGQAHNNMQPTVFGGNVYVFVGLPGDPPSN